MFPPSTPPTGPLPEDHREERLPGPAVGSLHHPERGLPAANKLEAKMVEDENERNHNRHTEGETHSTYKYFHNPFGSDPIIRKNITV